ncbi:unnamed protein product [Ascophyllum nodosum]
MTVSVRHTICSLQKRELWYEDIRASIGGSDFNPLAASAKFLSFVDQHGHGAVVLPLSSVGKGRRQPLPAVRVGAEARVRGLEWDPFYPENLATGGTDGLVKVWRIPENGLEEDLTTPIVSMNTLTGAEDGIPAPQTVPRGLAFHKSCGGLIASRGLRKICLFNLSYPQAPMLSLGGKEIFDGDTYDMQWSFMGDVLLTTDASRALKLIDIRANRVATGAANVHGPGTSRVTWCDSSVYMMTTGISKISRERELAVWDSRSLSSPVSRSHIGGTSSGFLLANVLYGLGLVMLCGRGDSTVRQEKPTWSFDVATGKTAPISTTRVGGVARAYAFVPRSSCDVMGCEVTRLLKLCDDGVQPVSIIIPRRDKQRFHEELFPPAPGRYASIGADDWFKGHNMAPYLEALPPPQPAPRVQWDCSPSATSAAPAASTSSQRTKAGTDPSLSASSVPPTSSSSIHAAPPDKQGTINVAVPPERDIHPKAPHALVENESNPDIRNNTATATGVENGIACDSKSANASQGMQTAPATATTATAVSGQDQGRKGSPKIKLRHVFGAETRGTKAVFNLSPLLTSLDGPIIACSDRFWAIPWVGGGGPVYVSPMSESGKVEPDCCLVNGHRAPVNSIAFSPFQSSLMATGSEDSTVKLWSLPDEVLKGNNMSAEDATEDLTFNPTAVRHVEFHPVAENVLMTTNADHSLQLCDVAAGGDTAVVTIDVHTHSINSASFNGDGSLIATTCRDGKIRVLDPRVSISTSSVVSEGNGHQGRKTMKAAWCFKARAQEILATTGCAPAGQRQLCLWDPRNLSSPYLTKTVDSSNGLMYPLFSEATGLLLLAGRGGSGIKYYELSEGDDKSSSLPQAHSCHEYKANGDPLSGVALLPAKSLDVANVEVARLLRLTTNTVQHVSFTLPRSGDLKEYFQDHVYRSHRPVRSPEPLLSSAEWLHGGSSEDADRESHRSLCPPGMQPLSERPAPLEVGVPKFVKFRQEKEQRERASAFEEKAAAETRAKMAQLANQNAQFNPNRSVAVVMGVDQPTIVDSGSEDDWSD